MTFYIGSATITIITIGVIAIIGYLSDKHTKKIFANQKKYFRGLESINRIKSTSYAYKDYQAKQLREYK